MDRARRVRSLRKIGALFACLLAVGSVTASPAHAADTGLSGVITNDTTKAALAGVTVAVYTIVEEDWGRTTNTVATTVTDANGGYSFPELPAGTYHLELVKKGYVHEYAHDQTYAFDAADVAVPGTYDEGLTRAAKLSGKLVDANGNVVTGGYVSAEPVDGGPLATSGDGRLGSNGYSIDGLVPGKYMIAFAPDGKNRQWAYGAATSDKATKIRLKAGANTVDDTLLPPPTGVLRGTVTDKATGEPLAKVCLDYNAEIPPAGDLRVCTGADGKYEYTGMATQEVGFWLTDQTSRYVTGDVRRVKTIDGKTVVYDIALVRGGRFKGVTVDAETGQPVPDGGGLCLEATPVNPKQPGSGDCRHKADGSVTIPQLAPGSYTLKAGGAGGSPDGAYGIGWVKADGTTTSEESEAGVFRIASGKDTQLPNVKLRKAGTITGIVTDKVTGKPLENVCAGVGPYNARAAEFFEPAGCTDANGRYTIRGLGPGSWAVEFVADGAYGWVWSGGAASSADATKVVVTSGQAATADMALAEGATLTGKIKLTKSPNYDLDVFNAETGNYVQYGAGGPLVKHTATYTVQGITPQKVKISFEGATGKRQWYGGTSFETATVVTIVPGTTTVDLSGK